jgi:hypothetical protein
VLGLDACQRVKIVRKRDGLPGRTDSLGQCVRRQYRQIDGLITHAATLSLLTRLFRLPASLPSGLDLPGSSAVR